MNNRERSEGENGKSNSNVEFVPPDGGWGWAIVVATALGNVIVIPAIQAFALLYRDRFKDLGMSATDISVVINVNSAFGMLLGLFHGSVLNRFGYRNVSAAGSFIVFIGFILTSFANSFVYFIITYGVITSIGTTIIPPSFQLALTTYFLEKRGKAMGLATATYGVGYVIMPPLVSYLLSIYGLVGAAFIISALSLNSLVGSALLQPIEWHMKKRTINQDSYYYDPSDATDAQSIRWTFGSRKLNSSIDHDMDAQSIYGYDAPIVDTTLKTIGRKSSSTSLKLAMRTRGISQSEVSSHAGTPTLMSDQRVFWWSAASSLNNASIGGSNIKLSNIPLHEADEDIQEEDETDKMMAGQAVVPVLTHPTKNNGKTDLKDVEKNDRPLNNGIPTTKGDPEKKKSVLREVVARIVKELDLTLLKDLSYLNLMIGMSLAVTAEINFSYMTPLFLGALEFSYDDTAILMAIIATADLIFRFITPFFADWLQYDAKKMYVISLFMLILSRSTMVFCTSFNSMIGVALAIGVGRGVRTVYMFLVIPSYVPIERLASASGLQMVANGLILLIFGPILGYVKDLTGTYNSCIIAINILTSSTLVMWLTESCLRRKKTSR